MGHVAVSVSAVRCTAFPAPQGLQPSARPDVAVAGAPPCRPASAPTLCPRLAPGRIRSLGLVGSAVCSGVAIVERAGRWSGLAPIVSGGGRAKQHGRPTSCIVRSMVRAQAVKTRFCSRPRPAPGRSSAEARWDGSRHAAAVVCSAFAHWDSWRQGGHATEPHMCYAWGSASGCLRTARRVLRPTQHPILPQLRRGVWACLAVLTAQPLEEAREHFRAHLKAACRQGQFFSKSVPTGGREGIDAFGRAFCRIFGLSAMACRMASGLRSRLAERRECVSGGLSLLALCCFRIAGVVKVSGDGAHLGGPHLGSLVGTTSSPETCGRAGPRV